MAYRLDRADFSSREIARMLGVSPATAWRLVGRGGRLPPHLRDGVDLVVPEPPRPQPERNQRDWARILRLAGVTDEHGNPLPPAHAEEDEPGTPLPNGEREGPARDSGREGEGENTAESAPPSDIVPGALRAPPHLNPPPVGGRTSERAAPQPQTAQTGEAVKRPLTRAERLWRTPLHRLMKERGFG
jgi:hypothetical protein